MAQGTLYFIITYGKVNLEKLDIYVYLPEPLCYIPGTNTAL